jgi:hypothetical protein
MRLCVEALSVRWARTRAPLGMAALALALCGCTSAPPGETAALRAGVEPASEFAGYIGRPFLVASQRMKSEEADAIVARAIAEHEMRRP